MDDNSTGNFEPTSLVQAAIASEMSNGLGEPLDETEGLGIPGCVHIDADIHRRYRKDARGESEEEMSEDDEMTDDTNKSAKSTISRSCKAIRPTHIDKEGNVVELLPRHTQWYLMYIENPQAVTETPKFMKKFRRRFRLPHSEFVSLLQLVEASPTFTQWMRPDATGHPPSPIGLLLLGALRYLGRGLTFDDLEEYTAIGEETHRRFFHAFIRFGEEILYPMCVKMPTTTEEFNNHRLEFDLAGLAGCGFSTDATNVLLWRCEHNLKQAHVGFKSSHPARSYNLTVNHRRQTLCTTTGHPSRWNDKTLACFDEFMCGIHEGRLSQDSKFNLLEWSGEKFQSAIVQKPYRGAWGLVDNGHHRWSCTQAPAKVNHLRSEERLSQFIESLRKDVECTFGILKGRWRILKTGIRLQGTEAADRIWLTCCALHNKLLKVDGLSEPWTGGLGMNEAAEFSKHAPFALRRLDDKFMEKFGSREHELEAISENGNNTRPLVDDDDMEEDEADDNVREEVDGDLLSGPRMDEDGAVCVNSLSHDTFRNKLAEHFDILHRKNRIVWPSRQNVTRLLGKGNDNND